MTPTTFSAFRKAFRQPGLEQRKNTYMEAMFIAPDIECSGCAASIQKALGQQNGINSVMVDVPNTTVTVGFDQSQNSREQIAETLADIGFPSHEASP